MDDIEEFFQQLKDEGENFRRDVRTGAFFSEAADKLSSKLMRTAEAGARLVTNRGEYRSVYGSVYGSVLNQWSLIEGKSRMRRGAVSRRRTPSRAVKAHVIRTRIRTVYGSVSDCVCVWRGS